MWEVADLGVNLPTEKEIDEALIKRHSAEVHNKLKNSRVAVAGLGGLGSNIAIMLTRAGVGTLHLIDFDRVELSNINRQQYSLEEINMYKTDAIVKELKRINPYVKLICDRVKVDESNLDKLFCDDKIVCEAFDNPYAKAMLVNGLLEGRDDVTVVSASGMAGFEKSNSITTKRITDRFYLCGDMTNEAVDGFGLVAPRVTLCAAHQANAVLRIILEKNDV